MNEKKNIDTEQGNAQNKEPLISKVVHKVGDEIHKDVDIIKHKVADELHREAEVISKVVHKIEDEIIHDVDAVIEGGEHLDEVVEEFHHEHPVKYNLILWVVGIIAFCVIGTLCYKFYY